jgi:ATP-dependent RNA helicase DeaD
MTKSFDEIGLEQNILHAINDLGFKTPMPVQAEVIPLLLMGKCDIVALAQTGTGKTAAFGLPIVQMTDTHKNHTQILILSPTRELCLQIADDLISFAKYTQGLKIAAVFGGASIERQIKMIKKGVHIISATPGRLIDLINRKIVNLNSIGILVLDEADEMLNMGFRDELEAIVKETPAEKNTLLFSATMPKEVRLISKNYMKNPTEITIGKRNSGAENIKHICYMTHAKDRYPALKRIVDSNPEIYGIVFCRTRRETQEVSDHLMKDGYNADSLHGDHSQGQRDNVMNKFRAKKLQLLVATDVAARGIDVDNISHIINYNLPDESDIYIHRSGRTGRAGREGTSIVIANLKEKYKIYQIEKLISKKFEFRPVPSGKDISRIQLLHIVDKIEKIEVDDSEINSFLPEILKKLEWLDREELIKKFVSVEFNRFIEYYKNLADLNSPEGRGSSNNRSNSRNDYTRFFINLGRMDDMNPAKIIGMINDNTGIRDIKIGEIEILKTFSFFEADSEYSDEILSGFNGKLYKSRKISLEIATEKRAKKRDGYSDNKERGRDFRKFEKKKNDNKRKIRKK